MDLTPAEKKIIGKTKEECPVARHRQIQGILRNKGFYLSSSSLPKSLDM